MNRMFKWSMILCCMIGYGELRVMSIYAAMFGIIIVVCAMIYSALDLRCRPVQRVEQQSKHIGNAMRRK